MTELVFTGPSGSIFRAGAGRPWGVAELVGWEDYPDVRSARTNRQDRHGSYAGGHYLSERNVAAKLVYRPWYGTSLAAALAELRAVTGVAEDTQPTPLEISYHGRPLLTYARITDAVIPQGEAWIAGAVVDARLEWNAPDPHRYLLPVNSIETPPSTPGTGGLVFPLTFPLIFGTTSTGGKLTMTNYGNAPAWPILELTGPGRGFAITDTVSGRALRLSSSYSLSAGEKLVIDTDLKAITLDGVTRSNVLASRPQWFSLPPAVTIDGITTPGTVEVALSGLDMTALTRLRATWYHTEV